MTPTSSSCVFRTLLTPLIFQSCIAVCPSLFSDASSCSVSFLRSDLASPSSPCFLLMLLPLTQPLHARSTPTSASHSHSTPPFSPYHSLFMALVSLPLPALTIVPLSLDLFVTSTN